MAETTNFAPNFVQNAIEDDLKNGKYTEGIHTRFPPNRTAICMWGMRSPSA